LNFSADWLRRNNQYGPPTKTARNTKKLTTGLLYGPKCRKIKRSSLIDSSDNPTLPEIRKRPRKYPYYKYTSHTNHILAHTPHLRRNKNTHISTKTKNAHFHENKNAHLRENKKRAPHTKFIRSLRKNAQKKHLIQISYESLTNLMFQRKTHISALKNIRTFHTNPIQIPYKVHTKTHKQKCTPRAKNVQI
jgi:hypothetical protein